MTSNEGPVDLDAPDLLCIILDLNPIAWTLSARSSVDEDDALSLSLALDQMLIFCNAHLALRHENELTVFGAGLGKSRLLFSSSIPSPTSDIESNVAIGDGNTYQQFRMVDDKISAGVKEMMEELPERVDGAKINLVGALAMSLCHINRINASDPLSGFVTKPKPRILILSVTEDTSSQYVPMMNCIFSAQKSNIPIDVCKIFGSDAVFLQQACHLTSGTYYNIERRSGLLQYLITAFLPGPSARKLFYQPRQEQVDLRAACFCHRKIIDLGYVCSVCLSIFCSPLPVCITCRTKFPMSTLKRFGPPPRPTKKLKALGAGASMPKKKSALSTVASAP